MSTMTITEFSEQMRGYAVACGRRNRTVISISAGIFAVTVFIAFGYPKFFLVPVSGLALVAICVTATCSRWHRKHGIFCPHCGGSLVALGETLEETIPDSLSCLHCREVVAQNMKPPNQSLQATATAFSVLTRP